MSVIKVHDKIFETYLSEETIQQKIKEIGTVLNTDYKGKRPLFIAILNGAFMFASDLFKQLEIDAEICFIKLVSYRGMKSTGKIITSIGLVDDLFGRDVILVEDIVDTGKTLHEFLPQLWHLPLFSHRLTFFLRLSLLPQIWRQLPFYLLRIWRRQPFSLRLL